MAEATVGQKEVIVSLYLYVINISETHLKAMAGRKVHCMAKAKKLLFFSCIFYVKWT